MYANNNLNGAKALLISEGDLSSPVCCKVGYAQKVPCVQVTQGCNYFAIAMSDSKCRGGTATAGVSTYFRGGWPYDRQATISASGIVISKR